MPEGDILRLTAARLDAALSGRPLVRAELRWPRVPEVAFTGHVVTGTTAYGKHLFTRLDHGWTLHTHLRMEGSWRIERTGTPAARAAGPTVRAVLAAETWTAIGFRLGMLDLVRTRDEHGLVGHLGPDVLADDFPGTGLDVGVERLRQDAARPVAEALLDQRGVAGLGTIWVAESLWERLVWPWAPVRDVDLDAVLLTARRLMERSIARGPDQPRHVHGRMRKACRRCGTPVAIGTAGRPPEERPIFFCPRCQHP